jgi:chemotaxis protein methyltransferase CheR
VADPAPYEPGTCDLILCRNVTIYFDRETTRALMSRLHACLRPGGYLFLGHAETLWQITDDFELVPLGDAFVYRRPGPAGERRQVLPDRRTEAEPIAHSVERRQTASDRRTVGASPVDAEARGRAAAPAPAPDEPVVRPQLSAVPPPQDADTARSAIRTALAAGRYHDAADRAVVLAGDHPLLADAHYLHGLALVDLGRNADAVVALRRALYLDGDHGFAHFLLGGALQRLGQPAAAAASYRAAAATLGRRATDAIAVELGGRSVRELAATCLRLATSVEGRAT